MGSGEINVRLNKARRISGISYQSEKKMKIGTAITLGILSYATVGQAQIQMPSPYGARSPNQPNDPYKTNGDPNYRYQGSNGTRYQYDLSNPSDQVRYSVDVGAQLRDSINVNPSVDLDRGLGQVGGGLQR